MFASGKVPGYDNISMRVIKISFHLISAPLTNIMNLSLQEGIFPDKLKLIKVIPIYKANDPSLFTNYRPIPMLSNFSNFFKKVLYNRITNLRAGSRWSTSKSGVVASAKSSGEVSRRHFRLASLHQTPSRQSSLLFAARACESKVTLLAGYRITEFVEQYKILVS